MKMLEEIKQRCEECTDCDLCKTRNNIVFADGLDSSEIMLIGEAPGENEDLQSKPFVGMAGKILNKYLECAKISRKDDLYITNIVKCRPPKNRKPKTTEKKACLKFLNEQIEIINPKLIILCGGTALETFVKNKKISDCHGEFFSINVNGKDYNATAIYHPSPLCRVANKQEIMICDLQKIYHFAK